MTASAGSSGLETAAFSTGHLTLLADTSSRDGDRAHDATRRNGVRTIWSRDFADRLLTLAGECARPIATKPAPSHSRASAKTSRIQSTASTSTSPRDAMSRRRCMRRAGALRCTGRRATATASARSFSFRRRSPTVPAAVDSHSLGTSLQMWRSMVRVGFDASMQEFSADYFEAGTDSRIAIADLARDVLAAYVTAERHFGTREKLSGGAWGDLVRDRGRDAARESSALSPRLALHVAAGRASRPFAVYAAAGGGFNASTLEQRLHPVWPGARRSLRVPHGWTAARRSTTGPP